MQKKNSPKPQHDLNTKKVVKTVNCERGVVSKASLSVQPSCGKLLPGRIVSTTSKTSKTSHKKDDNKQNSQRKRSPSSKSQLLVHRVANLACKKGQHGHRTDKSKAIPHNTSPTSTMDVKRHNATSSLANHNPDKSPNSNTIQNLTFSLETLHFPSGKSSELVLSKSNSAESILGPFWAGIDVKPSATITNVNYKRLSGGNYFSVHLFNLILLNSMYDKTNSGPSGAVNVNVVLLNPYTVNHNVTYPICYSVSAYFFNLIILKSNDVESNPGPLHAVNKTVLNVLTYNVNGLRDFNKLKRLNNYFHQLKDMASTVICLQETHFKMSDVDRLKYQWKWGSHHSPGTGASAGVSILYNESFFDKVIERYKDNDGRICSITAQKNDDTYCFINVYAPNDHVLTLELLSKITQLIEDQIEKQPTVNIIVAGDFNMVINPDLDSIGRNQTGNEKLAVDSLRRLMVKFNLIDSYRCKNEWGGFTWGRDNPSYMRSRLDMILIPGCLKKDISQCSASRLPNESDHSNVTLSIQIQSLMFGPGIIRCNSSLLDNEDTKQIVKEKIQTSINEIPDDWNPHQKLDFIKVKVRDHLLDAGRLKARKDKSALYHTNKEIAMLNLERDLLLTKAQNANLTATQSSILIKEIDNLKTAIEIAEIDIEHLKKEEADRLIFRSRAKWTEEGEKSTKYFMNLLKQRQQKMQIRKMTSNGTTYYQQNEISKAIHSFYEDLYKKQQNLVQDHEELFNELPQLSVADQQILEAPITMQELYESLTTCNESAPGIDGITYNIYKHFWDVLGPYVFEAWNYSCTIGKTTPSQQVSVISLLEKNGKDPSKIENLRPISLSNCDIKICTKAMALRTNKILGKIMSETQTGYIPGKQVNDNSRLIEEIISMVKDDGKKAYLVTLDAQKAFDSVDHEYMFACLRAYNFPESYIQQIKTIYSDLKAVVLVNGFMTSTFKIEQSVKQGDALSCALFIISMDPLLRKISKNENIKPIVLNPGDDVEKRINNAAYADDITGICANKRGVQEIINMYSRFSDRSGIKLNVPKTEILIVGGGANAGTNFRLKYKDNIHLIQSKSKVKICGITFSNDPDEAYQDNIKIKILKLERQLNIWRQRNLSLEGKVLIVKAFGLSQLIYSLQATMIKPEDIKEIESIIYKFIWNKPVNSARSSGRISREMLQAPKSRGGINAPNVTLLNEAIKYKNILRSIRSEHPIKSIINAKLNKHQLNLDDIHLKYNGAGDYLSTAIKAHNKLGSQFEKDIVTFSRDQETMPHVNYYVSLVKHRLVTSRFVNRNQSYLITNLRRENVVNFGQLKLKKERPNNRVVLESHQIWNSFPTSWRTLINRSRRCEQYVNQENHDDILIDLNKWCPKEKVIMKHIYKRLLSDKCKEKNIQDLNLKFGTSYEPEEISPFVICQKMTKSANIKNVQYKILHNAYPTMAHLHRWGIKESPNCTQCATPETTVHAVWECPIAQATYQNFKQAFDNLNPTSPLVLTKENIIFGLKDQKDTSTIITLIKQSLILQREEKFVLSNRTIEAIIKRELRTESFIATKNKNQDSFRKKWKRFIGLMTNQ